LAETLNLPLESFQFALNMPLESFQFALNLPLEAVQLADERKKREMKRTQITFKNIYQTNLL